MLTLTTEPIDEPAASTAALTASIVLRVWDSISSGVWPDFGSRPVWPAVQIRSPTRTAGLRMGEGARPGTVTTWRFIGHAPRREMGNRPQLYQRGFDGLG